MSRYDAAILGAGFAGLSIAARFCKRGKRVVLFDPAAEPGGMSADLALEGSVIPAAPETLFGFEPDGPLRLLCTELGIQINVRKEPVVYQVALPDHRITVFPERDGTFAELRREFPKEIDEVVRFYRALDAVSEKIGKKGIAAYFMWKRSAAEFMQTFRLSRDITAFFNLQSVVFFGVPLSRLGLPELSVMATSQPQVPVHGISGIMQQIRDFIEKNGGELRLGGQWPELIFRSNRVIGVRTTTGDVDAKIVVLNAAEANRDRRLLLRIRPEVLPVAMHRTVLWLPEYDTPDTVMAISIVDASAAKDVCSASITVFGPSPGLTADALVDRTGVIIPFLRDFMVSGGEADLSTRQYPWPNAAIQGQDRTAAAENGSIRRRGRSLYVLEDSHAGVGHIAREATKKIKGMT